MKNRKFMNLIEEVERREHDFMHLSVADRETKKNALAAVKHDPNNLHYVTKMADDYDVVKEAVQRDGMAIQFASKRHRCNKNIAEIAVRQNGRAFSFLSKELRKSTKLLRIALETDPDAILLGFAFQKHNPELVMMAVKGDPDLLEALALDDAIYVSDFSKYTDTPWEFDDEHYVRCKNREIVMEAVKKNGAMIQYASDNLQRDPEVVKAALDEDPDADVYLDEKVLKNLGFYGEK